MSPRGRLSVVGVGALVCLGVVLALWGRPVPGVLVLDVATIAVLAGLVARMRTSSDRLWPRRAAWGCAGALFVAALAALPWIGWWPLAAVLAFAVGAAGTGRRRARAAAGAFALGLAGGVANLAFLGSLVTGEPLRVDPAEFRSSELRAHQILSDVPLHDVWAVSLRGGGSGRTLQDVHTATREAASRWPNPMVMALVGLRVGLGQLFGWDAEADVDAKSSYVNRLTETDREQSLQEPGRHIGESSFWILYSLEREEVYEIRNRTVHAFMVRALVPAQGDYTLYWAIYVKPGQSLTSVYMGLIDPFRRLFVYPEMLLRTQRAWDAKWRGQEESRAAH